MIDDDTFEADYNEAWQRQRKKWNDATKRPESHLKGCFDDLHLMNTYKFNLIKKIEEKNTSID